MRTFPIAYGNSRVSKKWKNDRITFQELCERLKTTTRTPETVDEYKKLPKEERDRIKDKGGFVCAELTGGRRKKETVACRSALTFDIDDATPSVLEEFVLLFGYTSVIYSTHSHTSDNPRFRVIVPLTRDVTVEEFVAISRYVAAENCIDCIDPCSYSPHQLMYWPTTPKDGEYVYEVIDGEVLDPDKYLAAHPDWRDCSKLPISSREKVVRTNHAKNQADPLTKEGPVGGFNVCFTITQAIERFLPDVYVPSTIPGRYSYAPADSVAGLVIYDDDKFAYSHHASDPGYQKEMNAFDLVRIHKFPDEDEKKSYKAMVEFALTLDEVKRELARMQFAQASEDFDGDDWHSGLEFDSKGRLIDSLDNFVLIIRHDEELQNIAFNLHRDGIDVNGGLPWKQLKAGWSDSDYAALKVYLSNHYKCYSPTKTKDALLAVAAERSYHPVKEFLEALPDWDGTPRIDTLFIDYLGADDNSYTRAVSRKTMAAAVARIYEPGCKFDSVPILNGPQGIGKSTLFYKLAGKWFSDSLSLTDMKDKSGPEKLQGYWILELGELAGMRKTDVETVKSFLSRVDDKFRAAYGVSVESHPRQSIIVGSTNADSGYLRDITGNRRFWPIKVTGVCPKKPWLLTKGEVEQLWAEALVVYHKGEKLYLEGTEAQQAITEQTAAMEQDEREGLVRTYLDTLLPDKWDTMSLYERKNFLNGSEFAEKGRGTIRRQNVCNMEIWCECFGKDGSIMQAKDSYAIATIMKKIEGWERGDRKTIPIYGQQRQYTRKSSG